MADKARGLGSAEVVVVVGACMVGVVGSASALCWYVLYMVLEMVVDFAWFGMVWYGMVWWRRRRLLVLIDGEAVEGFCIGSILNFFDLFRNIISANFGNPPLLLVH